MVLTYSRECGIHGVLQILENTQGIGGGFSSLQPDNSSMMELRCCMNLGVATICCESFGDAGKGGQADEDNGSQLHREHELIVASVYYGM